MEPASTTVRIQGHEYHIRSDADPEHVRRIARFVDDRMRELSVQGNHVSTARVAILAALNIADELFRERETGGGGSRDLDERARRLATSLEETLRGASREDS